jgi:alanine racemase
MSHTSYLEISKSALEANVKFINDVVGADCEFVAVVKGNAYGHGLSSYIPLAYACGLKSFAVFSVQEAQKIVDTQINFNRLIIMGDIGDEDMEWVIKNEIDFFVFDIDRLNTAIKYAQQLRKKARIHIEIETGLNRTGFSSKELKSVAEVLIAHHNDLSIEGVCSHFGGAENISNYLRIKKQISSFNRQIKWLKTKEIPVLKMHLACSAAIINYPKTILDMARVGIMQYGFWPSKEVKMAYLIKSKKIEDPLKRVISWKSKVMTVKQVKTGDYIGYGNVAMAETDMKIAIVPVGYAHGFSRSLSNQGRVLIKGLRLNIIGMVNMNMIIIDATNLPDVKKGDEVVLIGEQGDLSISVASFSDMSDQLNYELLTRLPHDIPRIITK